MHNYQKFFTLPLAFAFFITLTSLSLPFALHVHAQESAAASFQITASTSTPTVVPDSLTKSQGDSIIFKASHFAMYEPVNMYEGSTYVGTFYADMYGNFTTPSFQLPFTTGGAITFAFTGLKSGQTVTYDVEMNSDKPWISLDSHIKPVGSTLTVNGRGYGNHELITIWCSGIYIGTARTDDSGRFNLTFFVPDSGPGQKVIVAVGEWGNVTSTDTFSQISTQHAPSDPFALARL